MKTRPRVLVMDDEDEQRELVALALEPAIECRGAVSGEQALESLWRFCPDLLVLDVHVPRCDVAGLVRMLRRDPKLAGLPVLVLTADHHERTMLELFDAGADDFVTKPFSPVELAARVRALLRRREGFALADVFESGGVRLTVSSHQVDAEGREVRLSPTEFAVLHLLLQQAGKVVPKDRLLEFLWGSEDGGASRAVDTHIANLRRKLGRSGARIETLRDLGLRFNP